jgi:hypothetical protein
MSPPTNPSPELLSVDVSVIQAPAISQIESQAIAEQLDLTNEREKILLGDLKNEVDARRTYAGRLFWLMVGWLVVAILFVLADALTVPVLSPYVRFDLSDSVLITLVTTTTATVVGVFLIVAKFLYRTRDS